MTTPGPVELAHGHFERSLVLIKPDGVRRGLAGEVIRRIETTGLKLIGLKLLRATRPLAERHYVFDDIAKRHGEAIWQQLLDYLIEGPIVVAVFEGVACIVTIRKLCGATEPSQAVPGSIRGDFCHQNYAFCNDARKAVRNVVHASANAEDSKREVAVWFKDSELLTYRRSDESEHHCD